MQGSSSLTTGQQQLISELVESISGLAGVLGLALGGSHARGRATPDSDIDLGVYYSETNPFSISSLTAIANSADDRGGPVVSDFYGWGRWVNGGAWLTIGGQRIDLIYRNVEQLERTVADTEQGIYEVDYAQQAPFGFFSGTYCGELRICQSLVDRVGAIATLKSRVVTYPPALRERLIQDNLWAAEFGIKAFARKFVARSDVYGAVSCLTRVINQLNQAIFAINEQYPVNDKTVLAEIDEFPRGPVDYSWRVTELLSGLSSQAGTLETATKECEALWCEVATLTNGLYQPRYAI